MRITRLFLVVVMAVSCTTLFLVLVKATSRTSHAKMKLYSGIVKAFECDPVITEYTAFKLLSENPLEADVNYLALPWAVMINYGQLSKAPDIKLNGGFTVCQHIYYEKIIPILKRIGIDTLFTPHVPNQKTYDGITVLPFPHYPVNGAHPAIEKDILYSFVGCTATHNVRKRIMNLPKHDDVVLKGRGSWHFARRSKEEEKEEYKDVLARSRFALCPRGTGASTIRFWEAMQAGAIPVLLADAMSLPPEVDWSTCIIKIPQDQVDRIDEIIRSIPVELEDEMRANCLAVFDLFYGDNFVRTIRCHYGEG